MTSKVVEQAREVFLEDLDKATEQVLSNWEEHVKTIGIEKKGGPGSGHHGHRGRPGKRGGSLPKYGEHLSSSELASEYVRIHNIASREYKAAFKKVGARMWSDDDAHPLKVSNEKFITEQMEIFDNESISKIYGTVVRRPLTVLDAYPDVTDSQKNELDIEVDKITNKYNQEWHDILYSIGISLELVIIKQLPIDYESKQALIKLRTQIFYDISDGLADQLYTGDISIGQWQESMKQAIREAHSSNAAIGKGGWDLMDHADWGRLGPQAQNQYRYLQGFAEHIDANRETVSLKHIKARARLYGDSAAGSAVLMEAGVVFEAKLPYMPKDGSTECLNRCHCKWVHNQTGTDGDFKIIESTWVLGIADHCKTCLDRSGHVEVNRIHRVVDVPISIGGY